MCSAYWWHSRERNSISKRSVLTFNLVSTSKLKQFKICFEDNLKAIMSFHLMRLCEMLVYFFFSSQKVELEAQVTRAWVDQKDQG